MPMEILFGFNLGNDRTHLKVTVGKVLKTQMQLKNNLIQILNVSLVHTGKYKHEFIDVLVN